MQRVSTSKINHVASFGNDAPAPLGARRRQRGGGFLLLAILLMMALMIVAMTIAAPRIVQQIKRDREEEMIHRGTEYARAIKKYYKKFGRYPANLEQLDNTNQIRFLRQRYKDPLTKDGKWKLLNYGDIQTLLNPGAPGTPAAALGSQGQGTSGQPTTSLSSDPNVVVANPQSTTLPGAAATANPQGSVTTGFAGNSPQANAQQGNTPFANTFSLGASSASNSNQPSGTTFGQNTAGGNQTFGGGAIVGVASLSKDPTIRIYNKKKTYNEWQFIYNPIMDRVNVLLRGPYQPTIIAGTQIGTPAGQMNNQPSGFGQQSTGFGQQQNPSQNSPVNQYPPDQNQQH